MLPRSHNIPRTICYQSICVQPPPLHMDPVRRLQLVASPRLRKLQGAGRTGSHRQLGGAVSERFLRLSLGLARLDHGPGRLTTPRVDSATPLAAPHLDPLPACPRSSWHGLPARMAEGGGERDAQTGCPAPFRESASFQTPCHVGRRSPPWRQGASPRRARRRSLVHDVKERRRQRRPIARSVATAGEPAAVAGLAMPHYRRARKRGDKRGPEHAPIPDRSAARLRLASPRESMAGMTGQSDFT